MRMRRAKLTISRCSLHQKDMAARLNLGDFSIITIILQLTTHHQQEMMMIPPRRFSGYPIIQSYYKYTVVGDDATTKEVSRANHYTRRKGGVVVHSGALRPRSTLTKPDTRRQRNNSRPRAVPRGGPQHSLPASRTPPRRRPAASGWVERRRSRAGSARCPATTEQA